MRTLAATVLLLLGLAHRAGACPPPPDGDENYRCSKYDRLRDRLPDVKPEPVAVEALAYIRGTPASLPDAPTHAQLVALVSRTRWVPAIDLDDGAQAVRIVDGAAVPSVLKRWPGVRHVIARSIDESALQVYFDDGTYTVQRCRDSRHRRTICLVRQP